MTNDPNLTREQARLLEFAALAERGANGLAAAAADPAGTLAERGRHDVPADEVAAFGQRHQTAADGARQYAAQLREHVASGEPVTDLQLEQADTVSHAAGIDGWLYDASGSVDSMPENTDYDRDVKQQTREYHAKRNALIESTGAFDHVEIPGERRPRWQLRPWTRRPA